MDMLHSQTELCEPIEYLIFGKRPVSLLLDLLTDITTVGIVHDDTQLPFFGLKCFYKLDDIWMLQMFYDLSLLQRLLFLVLTHPTNINDFHDAK